MGCDLRILCMHKQLLQCFPLTEVEQKSKGWICHYALASSFVKHRTISPGWANILLPGQANATTPIKFYVLLLARIKTKARLQLCSNMKCIFLFMSTKTKFICDC